MTGSNPFQFRAPRLLFAALALASGFAAAWLIFSWAASDFRDLNPIVLEILFWPSAIGALLSATSIGRKIWRGAATARVEIIVRHALAYGAAGFAWPLTFGLSALLQGDMGGALGNLLPAVAGLVIGAIAGALSGAISAYVFIARST
ncbi:MAG: hypothetical protein ABW199_04745 [Caulobacterales bacterium]